MLLNFIFSLLLSVGVPNISGASSASTTNYLSVKKGYVMSYNGVEGRANWVGWTLNASDVGAVDRTDRFIQDESLPLRLAYNAKKMLTLSCSAVYAGKNDNSLSKNKLQQI